MGGVVDGFEVADRDVRVDLGRLQAGVAEHLLDVTDVLSGSRCGLVRPKGLCGRGLPDTGWSA